jgi:hypothetical protein
MRKKEYFKILILLLIASTGLISCEKEEELTADYVAPSILPEGLTPGTPLADRILQLYDDYGVVVFTDPDDTRFQVDLISSESLQLGERIPADTAAALTYIDMIEDEFITNMPEDLQYLVPRNYYLLKNKLSSGTSAYNTYDYISYIWYNSNSDLTVGSLDNNSLDSVLMKQTFYYGLSTVLRSKPANSQLFQQFVDLKEGIYYWQVTSLTSAYENGFISGVQNEIKSDGQDFDLFAAWGATVDPVEKENLLSTYPLLAAKYALVSSLFRQEGLPLEEINELWQESEYNPANN